VVNHHTGERIRALDRRAFQEELTVQYRDFGRTGWKISEIAFGGWAAMRGST
jgi:hypothetical protein